MFSSILFHVIHAVPCASSTELEINTVKTNHILRISIGTYKEKRQTVHQSEPRT